MKAFRRLALTAGLAATAALGFSAPANAQTGTCTASFHVLHNDHIGRLSLPAGLYRLSTSNLTCAQASRLFTQFLSDFNGVLPAPWRYRVEAAGRGTFTASRGRSFSVVRTGAATDAATPGSASQGGGSHGDLLCPGTFEVENDDRVGNLRIPAGEYQITLLGGNLTCATAERYFAIFLDHPTGRLPRKWTVLPMLAEFFKQSSHHGFRIKEVL